MFPQKKEETNVRNGIHKDSDYFPHENIPKSQIAGTFNKSKRPLSSMVKKNQMHSNSQK